MKEKIELQKDLEHQKRIESNIMKTQTDVLELQGKVHLEEYQNKNAELEVMMENLKQEEIKNNVKIEENKLYRDYIKKHSEVERKKAEVKAQEETMKSAEFSRSAEAYKNALKEQQINEFRSEMNQKALALQRDNMIEKVKLEIQPSKEELNQMSHAELNNYRQLSQEQAALQSQR